MIADISRVRPTNNTMIVVVSPRSCDLNSQQQMQPFEKKVSCPRMSLVWIDGFIQRCFIF